MIKQIVENILLENGMSKANKDLSNAISIGNIGDVRVAIADGATNLDDAFIQAAINHEFMIVNYLLDNGANVNAKNSQAIFRLIKNYHMLDKEKSKEMMKLLAERGINLPRYFNIDSIKDEELKQYLLKIL